MRRGKRVLDDLDKDIRDHIERETQDNIDRGMSREEAHYAAVRKFGNVERVREDTRDVWSTVWLEHLLQHILYSIRVLRKSPGFTTVAILTLTLGIGANTSIFSVVYAALLRQMPYTEPSRLITLSEVRSRFWNVSYPDYLDWKSQSKTFQSLTGFSGDGFILHEAGQAQLVPAEQAATNFFSTLGVKPALGRDFVSGEDVAAGPNVAILTYNFWRIHFGGDPNVIGRTIQLDNKSVDIIGVLPRQFEFAPAGNADIWVPLHLSQDLATRRNLRWMPVLGRLGAGVTTEQARAEMNSVNARLAAAYPEANGTTQVLLVPLRDRVVGQIQPLLLILFAAVGFVLLIACANVANLLMVRAAERRREFAIRAALGASRGRLVVQLLTESLMLAAAGGALGFLAAQWGTRLLIGAIPQQLRYSMPFLDDAQASGAVFAFLCGTAVLTGVLFGLAPALQISHERLGDALKQEARISIGGIGTRLRNGLVVVEIAFSLVLLAGAGLMVKSLGTLLRRDPGFNTHDLLTFGVNLPDASYPKDPDIIRFDREFTNRVRNLPGIAGIATTSVVPLTGGGNTVRFVIEGQPMGAGHEYESIFRDVSNDYFSVMKIPLLAGRFFNGSDSAAGPKRVIVNQAWVDAYLHGQRAVGKRFKFTVSPTQQYREIVGVVGNIADAQLDSPEEPALFLPFAQDANSFINYVVRAAGNPAVALGTVRAAVREQDPQLFPILPTTMDEIIMRSPSVFLRRYPSSLIGSFAALALVLAVIGLYGLIAYSVSRRTREMGIRMALGAQRRDLLRLVVGQGARLALIGVGIGIAAALALTRLMNSLLYGVSASDPLTFGAVAIVLVGIALGACYLPARRATRVDPMVALRYE